MPVVRPFRHLAQTAPDERPRLRLLLAPQVRRGAFLQGAIALCHAQWASFVMVSAAAGFKLYASMSMNCAGVRISKPVICPCSSNKSLSPVTI